MRVIAGEARRILLSTPDGNDTRPTQDRIKETLFNIIQLEVPGSVFIDLCAGSGGIGIEALSRGARKAYFIENAKKALACIQDNLQRTRFADQGIILRQDALSALHHIHEKQADIIYIDPPYESPLMPELLKALCVMDYVTKQTLLIVETSLDSDLSFLETLPLSLEREKRYKGQRHLFLRRD
ncbi:MAG: 16S rRNA (guanine(966)-N(2))-methyltransferase RsmD [Lachnospiraceae bacterium]|nr:16S rRNA (guanine(966)-N(2))-methyltransferase RsmD [Lachnospiraceae bacterium]